MQCKAQRCYESQPRQLKNEGEKIFRTSRGLISTTHLYALPKAVHIATTHKWIHTALHTMCPAPLQYSRSAPDVWVYRLNFYSIMITLDKWVLITVSNSKCWCMSSFCWEREIPSWLPGKFGILKLLLTVFLGRDWMTQTREGMALACTYGQAYFTCVKSNSHFQREASPGECKILDLSEH